jgi:hypothetical protein
VNWAEMMKHARELEKRANLHIPFPRTTLDTSATRLIDEDD